MQNYTRKAYIPTTCVARKANSATAPPARADAHAVALARATDAERELSQARTTLARTPSEDARRAFHSELEAIRETARERLTRAEAAEGELASVKAVYASGLADRDAKLKDLEATLRRLRTHRRILLTDVGRSGLPRSIWG